ncbi:MAG: hypothetical protein KBB51_02020 [Candidatus Moranbacteria bacterium]|jgi:hypothetical protein|nr:hypothetical protein [Candidatus Moranbacteria bacterium]
MAIALWKAADQQDFTQANLLVDQEYRTSHYRLPKDPVLTDIRTAFPDTTVLITKDDSGTISGTIALIPDTERGLPIDTVFHEELSALRGQGVHLGEIGRLAVRSTVPTNPDSKKILPALYASIFARGLFLKIDAFVITINPKHEPLYQQFGFKILGSEKPYPNLKNAPALGRILFLKDTDTNSFRFLPKNPPDILFPADFETGKEPLFFL